jgi:hypothetical protein
MPLSTPPPSKIRDKIGVIPSEGHARRAKIHDVVNSVLNMFRWREKRASVEQFATRSPFHRANWPPAARLPPGSTPGQHAEMMRGIIRHLWRGFSPSGALEAQLGGSGADLRQLLARGDDWFLTLMRACTPVVGQVCEEGALAMSEREMDVVKARANSLHISLNAAMGTPRKAAKFPIWIRGCQRTTPLDKVGIPSP